jgi:bacterioferritin
MNGEAISSELLSLLNAAIARELQVSIQYMFQHAIGAGRGLAVSGKTPSARRSKFVASHAAYWMPGPTLKKTAITEMRHAEAIAERVVLLGGEPTTQPEAITIGMTAEEMLENDLVQEQKAIELYRQISSLAEREHDDVTMHLFQRILSDEEAHHRVLESACGRLSE